MGSKVGQTGVIAESKVAEVRERTDLAALVGEHVRLKRSGASLKGLCPFHGEKTPSFYVHPDRGFFHCFGCQASGDAIAFVMRLDGRSFPDAVRVLAERLGGELEDADPERDREARQARARRDRLLTVLDRAAGFYQDMLREHPLSSLAREEVERRGIGAAVRDTFRLGYAPAGWDGLARALAEAGLSPTDAEAVGLLVPRRRGQGHYDRFRHRLMFPVSDPQGRIVAFSGRALPEPPGEVSPEREPPAKYVNSPEHPLYTKGEVLFGLHEARVELRRRDEALLCEGNFDVLALVEAGFPHTCAPLGTAFTAAQARLLRRYVGTVTLLFDGDRAGRKAVRAAQPLLAGAGLGARVVTLPPGEDPDSFLRGAGRDELQKRIDAAPGIVEALIEGAAAEAGEDARARAAAIEGLGPVLLAVENPVEAGLYVERVARAFHLNDLTAVRQQLRRGARRGALPERRRAPDASGAGPAVPRRAADGARLPPLAAALVGAFLDHPSLGRTDLGPDVERLLTSEDLRAIFRSAVRLAGPRVVDATSLLSEHEESPARAWLEERLVVQTFEEEEEARAFVERTVPVLVKQRARIELRRLDRAIRDARRTGDDAWAEALLRRKVEVFQSAGRFGTQGTKG
ncbi:MAG: DNA primase [Sandaracinaceae bacterium]